MCVKPNLQIYLSPYFSPLVTIICFLCLWVCFINKYLCTIFLDSTYKWYNMILVFVWFAALSMTISRSIQVAANGIISFFHKKEWYSTMYMYSIFVIHSFVHGHLGCWHVLATVNSAPINIGMNVSFRIIIFSDMCSGVGLLDHMVPLLLVFWGISILFSIVVAPIYIPTNIIGGFPFLHTFYIIYYL